MKRVLNTKKFIMFFLLLILVCIGVIEYKSYLQKKKIEDIKTGKTNIMMKYTTGMVGDFDDYLHNTKYRKDGFDKNWTKESVTALTFGINNSDDGMSYYYIDNKEALNKIMSKITEVDLYTRNDSELNGEFKRKWMLQLFSECGYSIKLDGRDSYSEKCDIVEVNTVHKLTWSGLLSEYSPAYDIWGTRELLVFDGGINELLLDIYKEYVKYISVEDIISIKNKETVELTDIFKYRHSVKKEIKTVDKEEKDRYAAQYDFEIEGTDCFMRVIKARIYNQSVINNKQNEILYIRIYNKNGEKIDFFESSVDEIKDFVE